jgi:flagellar hook-basal body complex protein FliE
MDNFLRIQQQPHVLKPSAYMKKEFTAAEAQKNFSNVLKDAISEVNKAQIKSDSVSNQFINGKIDNLHDVMIAAEKASVARAAAVEVRNKVIDAYKEIMRMPM